MAKKFYEEWALVGIIDPDAYTAAAYLTGEIDFSKYHELAAVVMAGDLGTNATLDGAFHGSVTAGGSYAAISGAAITQLTDAGTDSNKQAVVHLRSDAQSRRYIKFSMTVATATSDCGVVVFGRPRYGPGTDQDLSSVDEVISS
jgi:hypothetical protein